MIATSMQRQSKDDKWVSVFFELLNFWMNMGIGKIKKLWEGEREDAKTYWAPVTCFCNQYFYFKTTPTTKTTNNRASIQQIHREDTKGHYILVNHFPANVWCIEPKDFTVKPWWLITRLDPLTQWWMTLWSIGQLTCINTSFFTVSFWIVTVYPSFLHFISISVLFSALTCYIENGIFYNIFHLGCTMEPKDYFSPFQSRALCSLSKIEFKLFSNIFCSCVA